MNSRCELVFPQALRRVRARTIAAARRWSDADAPVARFDPRMEAAARAEEERQGRLILAQSMAAAMDAVKSHVDARLDAARDWVVEFAFELASRVLDHEIDCGAYGINDAVRGCLDAAFETDTVLEVIVHPEDAAAANEVLARIQEESGMEALPKVTHSLGLARGACRVETRTAQFRHDPRVSLAEATERIREVLAG